MQLMYLVIPKPDTSVYEPKVKYVIDEGLALWVIVRGAKYLRRC